MTSKTYPHEGVYAPEKPGMAYLFGGSPPTKTLAIIKPDAIERNLTGKIIDKIESSGFRIIGMKKLKLSQKDAEGFYFVHQERPFFKDLCTFMSRNPIVVMVLEAEQAIAKWRQLMGATNPANAEPGTIRKEFGASIQENVVHGSDADETARFEISYFFNLRGLL